MCSRTRRQLPSVCKRNLFITISQRYFHRPTQYQCYICSRTGESLVSFTPRSIPSPPNPFQCQQPDWSTHLDFSALSFHPLQFIFNDSELATGLQQLQSDLNAANLSTFQSKQAALQIASINNGSLGQIEIAMVPGASDLTSRHSRKLLRPFQDCWVAKSFQARVISACSTSARWVAIRVRLGVIIT